MFYNSIGVMMSDSTLTSKARSIDPQPSRVHDDELLDWDCSFDNPPPPKNSGRIEVILRKVDLGPSSV